MPELVGTLINSILLEPGQGASGTLEPGQLIAIVDVAGQQVCDFSSFNRDDPTEYCDLIYSIKIKSQYETQLRIFIN